MSLPLFIVGDLNLDLLADVGIPLKQVMDNYQLRNYVEKPTRTAHRVMNRTHKAIRRSILKQADSAAPSFAEQLSIHRHSSTLIDVILHNGNLVEDSDVLGCPYSDHKFVVASLRLFSRKSISY